MTAYRTLSHTPVRDGADVRRGHTVVLRTIAVLVTAALVACGGAQEPGSTTVPTATAAARSDVPRSVTPSAESVPSASPAPTASTSPTPPVDQAMEIDWSVDFVMTAPGDWRVRPPSNAPADIRSTTGTTLWIAAGTNRWLAATREGPASVDEWTEAIVAKDRMVVGDPEVVEIGGAPGVAMDIRPTGEGCVSRYGSVLGECWRMFADQSGYWAVVESRPTRAWIIDVAGETLVILTDAPEDAFEDWARLVEDVLATLEWRS